MSKYLKHEDYWSIWIGFFCLISGLIIFSLNAPENYQSKHDALDQELEAAAAATPFKSIAWYTVFDQQQKIKGVNEPIGKWLKKMTGKPGSWKTNPLDALWRSEVAAANKNEKNRPTYDHAVELEKELKARAIQQEKVAAAANWKDDALNQLTINTIKQWRLSKSDLASAKKKINDQSSNQLPMLLLLFLFLMFLFGLAASFLGTSFKQFAIGFFFVFLIGLVSYTLAGQSNMKAIGFGYAAWAIVIGLLISNTVGTPTFVQPALLTPFYIKTGLVFLGAEILFGKILAIGVPGIFVAWVVTPIVLVSTYWFGQNILKIPSKTLNITISADMSVCGVSAAVATAAASNASKEELTLAIGLSMIFTSVMMIVLPGVINFFGMPEVLGGAWIGGTIDATGAVVAAGAFLGDTALNVAATIKMIQNILIGLVAFCVAIYFAKYVNNDGKTEIGWGEIWRRFPKFILGFIGASILFSTVYEYLGDGAAYTIIDQGVIAGFSKNLRGWLFCLAFVSIGLSTNFKALASHFEGGKPLLLYVCGQSLNLALTLLMAYLMFYKVFPQITAAI